MKILHTADWHLGKRLDSYSRLAEQTQAMDEIVQIADEQSVDLVLVAGDLFDSFNPPVEAIELFYKTVKRLAKGGTRPVIAIAGNHDSPALIDAPDPLARECGIILIGHPYAVVAPFVHSNFEISNSTAGFFELQLCAYPYPIRIMHTAYANEIRLKQYFGENKEVQLNQTLAVHWKEIADRYCDIKGVNLLMTHLYVNKRGSELLVEPEGEKPIKIGNADLVYADAVPPQIQYTALGHLHGFRNIGTPNRPVIYASSPLCYSFGEAGQTKYVNIIDIEPDKSADFKPIAFTSGRPLIRKTADSVDHALEWLTAHPDTLVELTLQSDTFLTAQERKKLFQSHDGIIYLIPKVKQDELIKPAGAPINLQQDIQSLFKDYFKSKYSNQEPNEDLIKLFQEILNS